MRADVAAFRYGLLSSSLSRALNDFETRGKIEKGSESLLRRGAALIDEIREAQEVLGGKSSLTTGKAFDLAGYRCALQLILDHEEEFNVHNRGELTDLFDTIHRTLSSLGAKNPKPPRAEDVRRVRAFFKRLSELMISELSRPEPAKRQLLASW